MITIQPAIDMEDLTFPRQGAMLLLGLYLAVAWASHPGSLDRPLTPWGDVGALFLRGGPEAWAVMGLLANATSLSYTSTHGSYYRPEDLRRTPGSGWVRADLHSDPPEGGLRALLFTHAPTRRALVAYRGTDLGPPSPGSTADRCAAALLFGDDPPPAVCRGIPPSVTDYFDAALRFAWNASRQLPGFDFLFTGHSLGAGLALLVAASAGDCAPPSAGAVAFASPPFLTALRTRTPTDPHAAPLSRFVDLADHFDPVEYVATAAEGLYGVVCEWATREAPPPVCAVCFAGHPTRLNMSDVACVECFRQRHLFAHYVHGLVPGPPPICAPRNPCPAPGTCPPRGTCGLSA